MNSLALCYLLIYICTGPIMFCLFIPTMFYNKLISHLAVQLHCTLFFSDKKPSRMNLFKDEILQNGILQAVPEVLALHVRFKSGFFVLLLSLFSNYTFWQFVHFLSIENILQSRSRLDLLVAAYMYIINR